VALTVKDDYSDRLALLGSRIGFTKLPERGAKGRRDGRGGNPTPLLFFPPCRAHFWPSVVVLLLEHLFALRAFFFSDPLFPWYHLPLSYSSFIPSAGPFPFNPAAAFFPLFPPGGCFHVVSPLRTRPTLGRCQHFCSSAPCDR